MTAVAITMSTAGTTSAHHLFVTAIPAPSVMIECRLAVVTPAPYLVSGGRAERYPLLGAFSVTSAATWPSP